ncbi:Nucleoporin NUP82 [Ceratocystis lukuohia]|uniref:Nucleoporin NUP82 n=1 Tax=Ceratocystis lukuohia TaxID=2019550 RepID=A0ABR4MEA1_9PEZI
MPKVKAYTPSYLATGAPGNALFVATNEPCSPYASKKKQNAKSPQAGPRRTIARRGTEIFVARGREIRWGDLAYLKEMQEDRRAKSSRRSVLIKREDDDGATAASISPDEFGSGYRTIKAPVADDIRQLIISPNNNYVAVVTTHTCHIMVIPDSSHLTSGDSGPIKPKIWTLGPVTHVSTKSALASVLWHPLGVDGGCVVTVSEDAIVRVWELSMTDRWSFDQPTLDIDLKKLADGVALDQNFSASVSATNTGFSPDSFEMEVAAACFSSRQSGGWSPFTLWIAMREGDVYALCPLLPQKWSAPPALIPSLSVSIVEKLGTIEDDAETSEYERLLAQQQLAWMAEIDSQEPQLVEASPGDPVIEVFTRPSKPGSCPRLQGPFDICADLKDQDDIDCEYTDIMVIGPKIDSEELMYGEDVDLVTEGTEHEGLSLSIVCLLSTGGQVKVCLDIDGVEAQWLPSKHKTRLSHLADQVPEPSLLLYQAMDSMNTMESNPDSWPVFSTDVMSKYAFYVTHNVGITYFSLASWVFRLESELQEPGAGSEFRIGLLVTGHNSTRERLYVETSSHSPNYLSACVAIDDPDVGYGIISSTPYEPVVLLFELPEEQLAVIRQESPDTTDPTEHLPEPSPQPLFTYEPRPAYTPSQAFGQLSVLPMFLERLKTSNQRVTLGQEVRLSPMTLQVLTNVHKILSDETHSLGLAASDLFLKCDRMHAEMREQLAKAAEIKARIDKIVGGDEPCDRIRIDSRLAQAQSRQIHLAERLEALRKNANHVSRRELSTKERAFADEVQSLKARVLGSGEELSVAPRRSNANVTEPWQRVNTVNQLAEELLRDARELVAEQEQRDARVIAAVSSTANIGTAVSSSPVTSTPTGVESPARSGTPDLRIPPELRKTRLQQVKTMLTRETALIEAVTARLERLQTEV